MNQLIDCITSLKDLATLALMWGGASGLIWLHDIVKAKRKAKRKANARAMTPATEQDHGK